jgi:hypothetical protein
MGEYRGSGIFSSDDRSSGPSNVEVEPVDKGTASILGGIWGAMTGGLFAPAAVGGAIIAGASIPFLPVVAGVVATGAIVGAGLGLLLGGTEDKSKPKA